MRALKTGILFGAVIVSCSHTPMNPTYAELPAASEASELRFINEPNPPCLGMAQSFCKSLYAPGNWGRLRIPLPTETYEIRRGQTNNDFSQVYYEYAQSQLRHRERLPAEFRATLIQRAYFQKLRAYLSRKPRREMSMEDRVEMLRLSGEIETIWSGALHETVLKRMEKRFAGYSRTPEDFMPIELANESKRERRRLIAEISKAIWLNHPNWQRVQRRFEQVRAAYRKVIKEHTNLSEEIKTDWLQRLSSVRLMVPGGDPEAEMYDCSRTEENAYYYTKKNYITVCAGDFNAEDMAQTLSHEMAHAFDVDRSITIHEADSELGKQIEELRRRSCGPIRYSCADWDRFKEEMPRRIEALGGFEPQLKDFNHCLRPQKIDQEMDTDYFVRVAREDAQDSVSSLAQRQVFLRMISPKLPLPDGTQRPNPAYMNPCGYFLWENPSLPLDDELSLLLFFTAEYRCTNDLAPEQRFQKAIETATKLQANVVEARIRMEGINSSRWRLNADQYASSPAERFADSLGGLAMAQLLKDEPMVEKRRATFLANTAWLCAKPSLRHTLPREAAILRQFYAEPHSEMFLRQQEIFSPEIREALQCQLDFEPKECRL